MTTKLVGAVAIKVKPDASDFRRDADRQLDRETRGLDREIDVKANVDADTTRANRKLDDLKQKAREALKVDVDVDDKASKRFSEYANAARGQMRDLKNEQRKLQSDVDNGMADNWAKRTGELKKLERQTKASFAEIAKAGRTAWAEDQFQGFSGVQKAIDKIAASQQKLTTISDNSWDRAAQGVQRYEAALAAIDRHVRTEDGSAASAQKGIALFEAAAEIRKQTDALKDQDAAASGLRKRWDTLGRAQKSAVSKLQTAEGNATMAKEEEKLRLFKEQLTSLGAAQVAKYKAEELSARELLAVEEELARRIDRRRLAQRYDGAPTINVDGMNANADKAYADEVEAAKRRLALQDKTAVELKKLQLNLNRELLAARRAGIEAHRLANEAAARATNAQARQLSEDQLKEHRAAADRFDAQQARANASMQRLQQDAADANMEIQRRLEDKRIRAQFDTAAIQRKENARLAVEHEKYLEGLGNMTEGWSQKQQERWRKSFGGITDMESLTRAYSDMLNSFDDLAARHKASEIKIKMKLDAESVGRTQAEIQQAMDKVNSNIAWAKIDGKKLSEQLRRSYMDVLDKKPGADQEWAKLTINLDKSSVENVKRQVENLREEIDQMEAHIAVNPTGLQLAAARFAYLTRPRTVNIIAKVNAKAYAMAEGALMALAGVNVARDIGRKFEKAFKELDTYALKLGKLATAAGALGGAIGTLTANLFSIGAGVAESVGLLALIPTAALAAFTGFSVFSMAFNNFSNAFSDIPIVAKQAMDELPPLARKAVKELAGTWKGISDPVQETFWKEMGNAVGQLKKRVLPGIKEGFLQVAPHAAKFTKGILDSFTKLADSGDMKKLFTNIGGMFDNASGAGKPFFDAFNTFGLRGSEFLPKFGTWLTTISTQFNNWVQTADEAGDITRWIEQGIQSLKDLWKVGGSVIDMFKGISRAALNAGGANLTTFADGMRNVADAMLAPVFQANMSTLFGGAIKGTGHLVDGVKDLGRAVGDTAPFWASFLEVTGEIAGISFSNIATSIQSIRFQDGILKGLEGMRDMVKDLDPTFRNVGTIIGDLGVIAGGVFEGMAPLINGIADAVAGVTGKLADNVAELSPLLSGQLAGTIHGLGTVIGGVATFVGAAVEGFLSLNEGVQKTVIALGAFTLLRGSISKTINAIANIGPLKTMQREYITSAALAGKTADQIGKISPATMALRGAGARFVTFTDQIKASGTAMGGVRTAGRNLFNLLGGGWGLAIAGATTLLSLHSQEQAKARENVDQLASSLDQQTGMWTAETDKIISKNLSVAESFLGFKLPDSSALDLAEKFGVPLDKVVAAAKGVPGAMDDITAAMSDAGEGATGLGTALGVAEAMNIPYAKGIGNLADKFGIGLSAGDKLNRKIDEQRKLMDAAREQTEQLATATGTSVPNAEKLGKAFDVIKDSAGSAADRVEALKTQLDILKGGTLSAKDAARNFAKEWESAISELVTLGKTDAGLDKLVDAKGNIEDLTGSGGKLYDSAKNVSDAILLKSQSAYKAVIDGKGTIAEAEKAATDALRLSKDQIAEFASATGLSLEKSEALLTSFFAEDWEMVALMGADAEAFHKERQRAKDAGEEFNQWTWRAYLGANSEGFTEAKEAAEAAGLEFNGEIYLAYLEANPDPAKRSAEEAAAWARAYADDPYKATIDAANDGARAAIEEAAAKGKKFSNDEYKAWLEALDQTDPGTAAAVRSIMDVTGDDYAAVIKALNETGPGTTGASTTILAMTGKEYNAVIEALDKTAPGTSKALQSVREMTSKEYAAWIKSLDKTDPGTAAAARTIRDMTDDQYTALIKAANRTKPGKDEAQRNINATKDKTADIKAADKTSAGRQSVQRSIGSLRYIASVMGSYNGWKTWPQIKTLSALVQGRYSGWKDWPVIKTLSTWVQGSYSGWKSWPVLKALSVSVWGLFKGTKGGPQAANGAIWDGKSDPLAGKWGMQQMGVKAFANGGIESHVAQIASPSSNSIRIWAEPETGGEAYIPLAASKRARSLEIWKETGKRLNAYADGGIEGGEAPAGVQQTFNITNNNPIAEKSSVATNRALQYASVPGL